MLIDTEARQDLTLDREELHLANIAVINDLTAVKSHLRATPNRMKMIELLEAFFFFYANFDFDQYGITLSDSNTSLGTAYGLFMTNPFNNEMNASKNVSKQMITYFQEKCRITVDQIEKSTTNNKFSLETFYAETKDESPKPITQNINFDEMNQ